MLAGILGLAMAAGWAVWKAPRVAWLPIGAMWLLLGWWSAEDQPEPALTAATTALADGLLRTVEGVVEDAGPVRTMGAQTFEDSDPASGSEDQSENAEGKGWQRAQRIDLRLTAAEVVDDTEDAMRPVGEGPAQSAGLVRVTVVWPRGAIPPVRCGQRLRAVVRMLPPETYHDPGVWSRAAWLESQNVAAGATIHPGGRYGLLEVLPSGDRMDISGSLHCWMDAARQTAANRLETLPEVTRGLPKLLRISPDDAAMLAALIAGDRSFLDRPLRAGFERTGSFHLIVVSGLHLAILAGWVFALARRIRLPRIPATAVTIAMALGYALFTGFAIPVQRSFWMVTLYLIGRLFYRGRSPLNVIGFAAICLLAADPRSVFDASLEMTLLAVCAIAGVAMPLLERTTRPYREAASDLGLVALDPRLRPEIAQFRVTLRLIVAHLEPATSARFARHVFPLLIRMVLHAVELVFVGLVVELALALPMATYFHRITAYFLPVNLIILPMLAILVPAAMLLLLALTAWPAAAPVLALAPAAVCAAVLHVCLWFVRTLGKWALGDLRVPGPGLMQVAVAVALFVLALQLARGGRVQRRLSLAAVGLMALAALWPRPIDHPEGALLFEAVDVGQGDSLLLITPEGQTVLIDGGGLGFLPTSRSSSFDIGEEVVSEVLWARGIRRLDVVALTHAHQDHMGGLPAIVRNFRPRELWVGNNPTIPAYAALLKEARAVQTAIRYLRAGERLALGGAGAEVEFRVLAPEGNYVPGPQPGNNDSLVLQAQFGETGILLAGDAEAPEEKAMLEEAWPASSVLKVGHHGSVTSTRPEFLARVSPEWAVISCGRRNRFGHPRGEILAELEAAHVRTFRTDVDGATCLVLDGRRVEAQPMCR
jgi:competence protein ComEC